MTAGALALALAVGSLAGGISSLPSASADWAPADPADPATPATVTADGLPTVQMNGVAWAQAVIGNTVYVAGSFTRARPAGAAPDTQEVVRNNLLAYDIRTGELVTTFAPSLNGQALALAVSPDRSRLYVGGDFTSVNGQARGRVAALTPAGALIGTWRPSVSGSVNALAATDATVFLGGSFSAVGKVARNRLASVTAATGALKSWAPQPGYGTNVGSSNGKTTLTNEVLAMVLTNGGSQLVVAGRFGTLNGAKAVGVGALNSGTGATRPFAVGTVLENQGINSAINSLSTDGTLVYGTGYKFQGHGNLEGVFAAEASGGSIRWIDDCRGDSYGAYATREVVYVASHAHSCGNIGSFPEQTPQVWRFGTAVSVKPAGTVGPATIGPALRGKPAPAVLPWFPTMSQGSYTGQYQASWTVTGTGDYVAYGGEFPRVNGVGQQGLVRYATTAVAPDRIGPGAGDLGLTATALLPNQTQLVWKAAHDQDNANLTYQVHRDGDTTTPVATFTRTSEWWNRPMLGLMDRNVPAGPHTYRVTVSDPSGNRASTGWVGVTVTEGSVPARPYAEAVRADDAVLYWPLREWSGTRAYAHDGGESLLGGSGFTRGVAGAIAGDGDRAIRFPGTSTGFMATQNATAAPQTFSAEFWFSTTTKAGGRFIGFGSAKTGTSAVQDRLVYMDTTGRLNFGVTHGATSRRVTSPSAYNDGRWHHVVASMSTSGLRLFVDGRQVAARTDATRGLDTFGYWRIGGDRTWSGAQYVNATMDEVAIYQRALSPEQVAGHHALGTTGRRPNAAPIASFTAASTGSVLSVDGSSSADSTGSIRSWSWNWGDGTPAGSGAAASHAYATGGTYPVTLTVTDDGGLTGRTTRQVTVASNQPPEPAFTLSATGATVGVRSMSTDADGSVAAYSWDWGDGTPAGSGETAQHTYGTAGTYTVVLTVTDDVGATAAASRTVTVEDADGPPVIASDSFDRTVSGGLGAADIGGAWTPAVGATRLSVEPGVAELALPAAGDSTGAYLDGSTALDTDVRTSFALDAMPTGGGTYVFVSGRRTSAGDQYSARVRVDPTGAVWLVLSRIADGTETFPGGEVLVEGLTYTAGSRLEVRVELAGGESTRIAARVWPAGSPEPQEPQLVREDSTAGLQAPGPVGIAAYRPRTNEVATIVRFGPLTVTEG